MTYDRQLTTRGKRRAAALEAARRATTGRVPKIEWTRVVGVTPEVAIDDADTHMPPGLSVVKPTRAKRSVDAARRTARRLAIERAEASLQRAGEAEPTPKRIEAVVAEDRRDVQRLNQRLAGLAADRPAITRRPGRDEDGNGEAVRRVLRQHAETASGITFPDTDQEPTAQEKEQRTHQFHHLLNRA